MVDISRATNITEWRGRKFSRLAVCEPKACDRRCILRGEERWTSGSNLLQRTERKQRLWEYYQVPNPITNVDPAPTSNAGTRSQLQIIKNQQPTTHLAVPQAALSRGLGYVIANNSKHDARVHPFLDFGTDNSQSSLRIAALEMSWLSALS